MAANVKTNVAQLQAEETGQIKVRTHMQRALMRLRRDRLTLVALAVLGVITLLAVLAEPITLYVLNTTYASEDLGNNFTRPGSDYLLGTDEKGRDVFARLLYGTQVSLRIAFFAAILSLGIGVTLGMITGYYGGIVDDFLTWFITTLNSIPSLFLLLIIASILEPNSTTLIFILGFLGWTGTMRLVRGESLSLKEREFIIAARAMGASSLRIMFQHILPNLISLVVVTLAIDVGGLILTEAALSFLNFGIAPPEPSLGNMLTRSSDYYRTAPHLVIIPGLVITIIVLCLFVIGDGIRDALDPTINP
jgi:peptide/nickel transport system permease protein